MKMQVLAPVLAILTASWSLAAEAPDEHTLDLDYDHGAFVNLSGKGIQITDSPISVQAWFRTTQRYGKILESGAQNRSPGELQSGYALYMDFNGNVRFGVNTSHDGFTHEKWDDATTKNSYRDGKWYHVTGVFAADGETRVKIFIDGKEIPERLLSRAGDAQPALVRYVETNPPSKIGAFKGHLDELRVWNIALSARQIAANYNQRIEANTSGLVAQWSFEPGDSHLADAAGDHRGTLHKVPPPAKPKPPLPMAYDYSKHPGGLTGYTGYERNRIGHWTLKPAARQRLGSRGLCEPTVVKLADGALAASAAVFDDPAAPRQLFRSADKAVTWTMVTTQNAVPQAPPKDAAVVQLDDMNMIATVFADGSMPIPGKPPPRGLPKPAGDRTGEHALIKRSADGGETWAAPEPLLGYSETDAHLLKLADGRLLCTYDSMHVPFGIMAIISTDQGRTWDREHPVFLARAWGPAGGNPSSVQLDDGTIVTVYCIQAYRNEGRDTVVESVRWQLPAQGEHPRNLGGVTEHGRFRMELHDYGKYPAELYGYSGVNRHQVAYMAMRPAVRATIGHRGLYKGALAQLPDGTLVATPCLNRGQGWPFTVYHSSDAAASWQFVSATRFSGKELGAAVLRDGALLILSFYGKSIYRSTDAGLTWDYYRALERPAEHTTGGSGMMARNLIENPDGSLFWIGGTSTYGNRKAKPSVAWRLVSRDGGRTWGEAVDVPIRKDAEGMFDEAAMIRLDDGRLLAASRVTDSHVHGGRLTARLRPKHDGEDADHMVLVESHDDGFTWTEPRDFLDYSRVHAELVKLKDGRLLSCYAAYHLPLGVFAVLSEDNGRTWSTDTPIQLAISTRVYTGWPTSVQLDDGSIVTMYALGTYLGKNDHTLAESVRWTLPPKSATR